MEATAAGGNGASLRSTSWRGDYDDGQAAEVAPGHLA